MEPMMSCFAPGIRGWAKHISGKWRGSLKKQNCANGPKYWFPSDWQPCVRKRTISQLQAYTATSFVNRSRQLPSLWELFWSGWQAEGASRITCGRRFKRENGIWWQSAATCRFDGNVENDYCFATPGFHLSRRHGWMFVVVGSRTSRVAERHRSGVFQDMNIPHREAPCRGRCRKIFLQGGCDTHQPQPRSYPELCGDEVR